MHGHAFIAFHGSWNRDTPTGYSVGFVPMTEDGFVDAAAPSDFLSSPSDNAKWSSEFRPVDVAFGGCGKKMELVERVAVLASSGFPTGAMLVALVTTVHRLDLDCLVHLIAWTVAIIIMCQ
jgi:hypothetical protein